jgi:hypothetical protein
MVKYTLTIANENQPNLNPVSYSLELGYEFENNPERFLIENFANNSAQISNKKHPVR